MFPTYDSTFIELDIFNSSSQCFINFLIERSIFHLLSVFVSSIWFSTRYGRHSNSLDVILLGWLPIRERINFCIIKLAHKAFYVTSFSSYLKVSFKKVPRYLRNKDKFWINDYDKNSNIFIGKARILLNNLPYLIKFLKRGKEIVTRSGQSKIFSTPLVNRFQPYLRL